MRNRDAVLQSGQALVLGVGLLTLGVLAWLLMLQVGGWVHNKSSLHRATDAAAYSAALVYARALNLHAYLNRAQLAHQVAQLHLFSLASAERFRSRLARQATTRNPPASLLGFRFGMHYAGAYVFARQGGQSDTRMRNALHKAFEQHEQLIHASLHHIRQSRMNVGVEISRSLENTLVMNLGKSGSDNRGSLSRHWACGIASCETTPRSSLSVVRLLSTTGSTCCNRSGRAIGTWMIDVLLHEVLTA